ncbi:MAG: alpha-L-fucosidase [Rikenella sp.]|nr:alpha-L-fucosidase [Rikenella sp.]
MKKALTTLVGSLLFFGSCGTHTPEHTMEVRNTIAVEPGDSAARIIEKAAHVVPTANQLSALRNEFIAFIHFGPNTFTRMEWGNGMEDPRIFDLKELDTDQWCEAMQAAGMKMVLLTVKHHDGFVLWQSRYTDHGVMSTGFRDGKGDILRDLSESCRKYGLKLGIYLSPADLYQIENPDGLYGNLSPQTRRTIPREVEGRPFADTTRFEFVVDDYNEYFLNQLFELLTEYGPIYEVWFDGAHPKRKGGQTYNYAAWKELIHRLAPEAVIFGREDVRWCGNEAGGTRATEWNVIPYPENPDTASHFPDMTDSVLGSREKLLGAKYLHYQQAETNTSIREGWFYRDDTHQQVRSADDVFDIYERAVGGNSTFLLNIPPNREGRFSTADVETLKETGRRIRETYGTDLLAGADGPKAVLDGREESYLLWGDGTGEFTIELPEPTTLNRIVLQEAIGTHGERVERHAVDAWIDGAWREIASATNVGYKRILRFPDVTTDKLRFRLLESRMTPAICRVSAHHYASRPPQLTIGHDAEGRVAIAPRQEAFGWKPHGENATDNLNAGYRIYYTTDGTEPDEHAILYEGPVKLSGCELKAVAVLNGTKGATVKERLGLDRTAWTILRETSPITIDLGEAQELHGIAYDPQTNGNRKPVGVVQGTVSVSDDGRHWKTAERFEFGNLINDPTKRYHYFKTPYTARHIRIEPNDNLTLNNFDLF